MKKEFNVCYKYVNRTKENWSLNLEMFNMSGTYIGEAIGDSYRTWTSERPIILSCQTGCGKTTFCEDILISDAIQKNKKIILASNRLALSLAEKKRILKNSI